MPLRIVTAGVSILLAALLAATPAAAVCRDVTVSATGARMANIDDATSAAGDALGARIRAAYGQNWGVGSRRNGSFRCDKALAGAKPAWVCTATTSVICAP